MGTYSAGNHKSGNLGEEAENQEKELVAARTSTRKWISKIIFLTSGIAGFSVSLFSINVIQSSVNLGSLETSWYFFLITIVVGTLSLMLESRIVYAAVFREQGLLWNSSHKNVKAYCCKAIVIFVLAIFYPSHMIFNKLKEGRERDRLLATHNLAIKWLRYASDLAFLLEDIFIVCFVLGLYFLIRSVVVR